MMKPPFKASDGAVMHCGLICVVYGFIKLYKHDFEVVPTCAISGL